MRVLARVVIGLLFALTAASAGAADKPELYPGTYSADPAHSKVMFITTHMGLSTFIARFDDYTTQLTFDPEHWENSTLKVTVKPTSVDIDLPLFAEHMSAPEWFDTARYPEMTFTSTRFIQNTPTTGKVEGTLSIKGIARPVTLDVRLVGAGINPLTNAPAFGIEARAVIMRSDYGMTADLPLIPDRVRIWINAEFEQQEAK